MPGLHPLFTVATMRSSFVHKPFSDVSFCGDSPLRSEWRAASVQNGAVDKPVSRSLLAQFGLTPKSKCGLAVSEAVCPGGLVATKGAGR